MYHVNLMLWTSQFIHILSEIILNIPQTLIIKHKSMTHQMPVPPTTLYESSILITLLHIANQIRTKLTTTLPHYKT